LGIPHSIFLGRIVTDGEPYWLPDDTEKALAWRQYEAERCVECRTHRDDWVDEHGHPLAFPKYRYGQKRCHGCEKRDAFEKSQPKNARRSWIRTALFPNR
jgi:hypothetical protein